MQPNQPQALPTVEEVARFMLDWRTRVQQTPGLKDATLTCHAPCAGMEVHYRLLVWEGRNLETFTGDSPDDVIAKAIKERDPKRKVAALRAEAKGMIRRADALEMEIVKEGAA